MIRYLSLLLKLIQAWFLFMRKGYNRRSNPAFIVLLEDGEMWMISGAISMRGVKLFAGELTRMSERFADVVDLDDYRNQKP